MGLPAGDRHPPFPVLAPAAGLQGSTTLPMLGSATLELAEQPLHQQIQQFAQRFVSHLRENEVPLLNASVEVVPLFLLQGVHVMEDIPAEVAIAQRALAEQVKVNVRAHLGSYPGLKRLLHAIVDELPATHKILLAHGSRRPGSSEAIESLAADVGAIPAYWAVSPSVDSQVASLVSTGCQQITVLPYFLFSGGITDAIAQLMEQLSQTFPHIQLQLAQPLGASPALAKVITDNI